MAKCDRDRPTTITKGAYGRPSSFGRPTTGYKGWMPVYYNVGKNPDGSPKVKEGYKNVLNNQEHIPAEGHNGEPPYPTGELTVARTASEAYREGWERIWGKGKTDAAVQGS